MAEPVVVKVERGIELVGVDHTGKTDPYIAVELEVDPPQTDPHGKKMLHKTHVVKKNLNPVWGDIFNFSSQHPSREYIRFYLFDHDTVLPDRFLGWGEIPIAEIRGYNPPMVSRNVKLHSKKGHGHTAGEVAVSITYGNPQYYQQPQVQYVPVPVYVPQPMPQQPPPQQPPPQQPPPQQPPSRAPPAVAPTVPIDSKTKLRAQELGLHGQEVDDAFNKFNLLDTDHTGVLNFEKLKHLLQLTVAHAQKEQILDRYAHFEFQSVDINHSGTIDFYEFLQVYYNLKNKVVM